MKTFPATLAINKAIISHETNHLRDYAAVMERVVAAEADRESYSLDESTRYLAPEERAEVYAENADYLVALTEHFIFQHRLSIIATIYAVFESHLTHLCRMLCSQKNVSYGLRDLSGNSNLDKAKRLLSKFLNIPLDDAEWQRMQRFSSLRNIASHQNGQLTAESAGAVKEILASFPDILEHDSMQIKPKYSAAFTLLDAVDSFYSALYRTLDTWGRVKPVAP
jgi:hypothetical protein